MAQIDLAVYNLDRIQKVVQTIRNVFDISDFRVAIDRYLFSFRCGDFHYRSWQKETKDKKIGRSE